MLLFGSEKKHNYLLLLIASFITLHWFSEAIHQFYTYTSTFLFDTQQFTAELAININSIYFCCCLFHFTKQHTHSYSIEKWLFSLSVRFYGFVFESGVFRIPVVLKCAFHFIGVINFKLSLISLNISYDWNTK